MIKQKDNHLCIKPKMPTRLEGQLPAKANHEQKDNAKQQVKQSN